MSSSGLPIEDATDGTPAVSISLSFDAELAAWIEANGGAEWLRDTLRTLKQRRHVTAKDKVEVLRDIEKIVLGAIKDTQETHGEMAPSSIAKRAAGQIWAAWYGEHRKPVGPIPDEPRLLLDWLEARGVRLWQHEGQQLRFVGSDEALSPAVRKRIRAYQAALLDLVVADPERFPTPTPNDKLAPKGRAEPSEF